MSEHQLDVAIAKERKRRQKMKSRGFPLHYWKERGDKAPPIREHWCDWCVGFYGVPHDNMHFKKKGWCQSISFNGKRQCACIDCVVAEKLYPALPKPKIKPSTRMKLYVDDLEVLDDAIHWILVSNANIDPDYTESGPDLTEVNRKRDVLERLTVRLNRARGLLEIEEAKDGI